MLAARQVMRTFDKVFVRGHDRRDMPDWKKWKHSGGGAPPSRRGGGAPPSGIVSRKPPPEGHPQYAEYKRAEAEWRAQRRVHEELGRLRGLPAEPETPLGGGGGDGGGGGGGVTYRVVGHEVAVRLAPSTSAATNGPAAVRGEACVAIARRGLWIRLDDEPLSGTPRWLLTRHPEQGTLLEST